MAAPVLESLNPASVDISSGADVSVTLIGTGFEAGCIVVVDGIDGAAPVFVSDTELTADFNSYASQPGSHQVAVKNGPDASNELPFTLTGTAPVDNPEIIPDTPAEGASPNTEAERAVYMSPVPPDVYQQAAPVQFTEPTATGVPKPHIPEPEELPTTNAYDNGDGGLPSNPREPYPTGRGTPVTFQEIRGNG